MRKLRLKMVTSLIQEQLFNESLIWDFNPSCLAVVLDAVLHKLKHSKI